MSDSSEDRDPVEALAEEFVDRHRQGEKPALQEYVDRYPQFADDIRDLFPALLKMEKVRPQTGDLTGDFRDTMSPAEKKLERLGDYRILREVGRGGMGIVYEAEQESLGRHVALKVLPHHALLDSKHLQRFHREAKAAARLHHTNIVPVYGVGADDGLHYYVMQFIHGMGLHEVLADLRRLRQAKSKADRTLANRQGVSGKSEEEVTAACVAAALLTGEFTPQSQHGPRSPETVSASDQSRIVVEPRSSSMGSTSIASDSSVHLPGQTGSSTLTESGRPYWQSVARIGVQIADALAYAHSQGTLHRDIKPSNLLLDNQGTVWVTDFGLAKASDSADLTHTGDIIGTVRYMAPERFKGLSDARSDIYGLGLTLYEMLALRPAFAESDRNRLIREVTHEEPPRPRKIDPEVPRDLETIVLKAISKEPAHRYSAAGELAADLQRFLEDKPIQARRVSPRERLWRWCRRNPGLASTIGLAAALLLAVSVVSTWFAFAKADFATQQFSLNQELAREQKQTLAEKERAEGASRDLVVSLEKSQRLSALMAIEKAQNFVELHQTGPAMVWLARALKLAPADAMDLQHASRGALSSLRPEVPHLKAVIEHHSPILGVALSPDGKTLITGGGDYLSKKGDVQLWDLATGKPIGSPLKYQNFILSVAFSPDGKKVLTAGLDRTARLWDVATGQLIGRPLKLTGNGYFYSGAFSPDGKWVFTGGTEQGQLWDATTAEPAESPWHNAGLIYAVAFSPDGKTIVTGSGNPSEQTGQIRFWRINPSEHVPLQAVDAPIPQPSPVMSVAFSPDGSQVLYGSADGRAQLLDSATRRPRGSIFRHHGPILHVSFSPDGQWVITAGSGFLRLWDVETGQPVGDPLPQYSLAQGGGFCPDGRTLVVPRTERTVGIWELPLGRLKRPLLPHPAPVTALSFSPDGKKVLTGCGQESRGESQLWDVATGEPLGPPLKMASPVSRVAFSPDGRTMVATPTVISGQLLGQVLIQSDSLAFSADGKTVVTGTASQGGQNQSAALRDIFSGKHLGPPLVVTGALSALDVDPKGETVATASGDISRGELQFWNARTGQKIGSPMTYASRVLVARFSPDGLHVVTGHYDSRALLWNTSQGKRQGPALVHQGPVRAAAFSPDGQFLVTGSVDRMARIWHVKTGQPVGLPLRHPGSVTAVAFSPDGGSIMTGCADGLVRFWQAPTTSGDQDSVRTIPVVTGLSLSDEGELGQLEGSAWQDLRETSEISEASEVQAHAATPLPWHLQQALQAMEADAWKTAQWHLQRELQAHPDDWLAPVLQFRIIEQTAGDAEDSSGALAKAAAAAESALKSASGKMALPWLRKFSAEAERKQEWTKALWYLDRIVAAGLDDRTTPVDRAQIFVKLRKWDEAAQAYGKAIAANTNDHLLWLERGRIYARLEKWDQVAADFTKAIELLPEARSVNDRRSEICAELAKWDQAMTKAVQLMPRGSDLYIAAGRYHARQSQWDKAAADFTRADWSRPLGDDTFEYACLFLIRGDVEGYRKFCEGLSTRIGSSKDPFAAFVMARIMAMAPPGVLDPARAVQWGKLAVASDPKVPWYLHALALAHYRAGQFDLALQRFQESLDGYWNFPELNYLGRALAEHRLGHAASAQENLDQGLAWLQKHTPSKPDSPTDLFATDWLEGQLLRREAEALMKPAKKAGWPGVPITAF